ncbi:MAG TPA: YicC/YloC family endoribonuclease [Burkholderiaceae bacterium]|nr:YicC/YloC family endoribonuclease [Burkholderiaceae bacterium]
MTGFSSATQATPAGAVTVELKSVNSRFLDFSLRQPDELRAIEPGVREAVAAKITRGKVECRINIARDISAQPPRLNPAALERLAELARSVAQTAPDARTLAISEILQWPGVVEVPVTDVEELGRGALRALGEALRLLQESRAREGAALRGVLRERCDAIVAIAMRLKSEVPAMLVALERKLNERLSSALAPAIGSMSTLTREEIVDRIRQEVTLYGLRADVDEELQRLTTHVNEVRRVLEAGGPVGRRLDFLMQELNREANTLGSKATAVDLSNAAVELKLLIEQMREQVQNIE